MRSRWKVTRMTAGFLLLATAFSLVGAYAFAQLSPWPMVLLRRLKEDRNAARMNEALQPLVPSGILAKRNLQYDPDDSDALLDVYFPSFVKETKQLLPVVIWVHGGSWVTGSKDHIANYLKILTSKGFTVVGVDYGLAPTKRYPSPVKQVNQALDFLQQKGEELHADTSRVFLAGDFGRCSGRGPTSKCHHFTVLCSRRRYHSVYPSIATEGRCLSLWCL